MKSLIRVSLLLAVLLAIPTLAQTPPVANADGTITGDLIGTLSGTVLTIQSPGAPGSTPTLNNTNSANPIRGGVTGAISGILTAGSCDTGTASISGAATSMVAVASASTSGAPGAAFYVKAQVTSANTVTVSVCAAIDGTPTSSTYIVRVIG